jgi:hypothetical protein
MPGAAIDLFGISIPLPARRLCGEIIRSSRVANLAWQCGVDFGVTAVTAFCPDGNLIAPTPIVQTSEVEKK